MENPRPLPRQKGCATPRSGRSRLGSAAATALLVAVLAPSTPAAEHGASRFRHLTAADGLSQNGGLAILRDRRGFMWIGTEDGLNRYDGHTFVVYRHDPSLPGSISGSFVLSLLEDSRGVLWAGTLSGGLNRFDRARQRFVAYRHDPANPESLSHDYVYSIYEDPRTPGRLWVATAGGLDVLDTRLDRFVAHYRHRPGDPLGLSHGRVHAVRRDRTGALWIGTGGGLDRLSPDGRSLSRYTHDPRHLDSLSHDVVRALHVDPTGTLWVGTENGLNRHDPARDRFVRFGHEPADPGSLRHPQVRSLATAPEDPTGLWIGTYGGGVSRLDLESGRLRHHPYRSGDPRSPAGDHVFTVYPDGHGLIWIGLDGSGVSRLDLWEKKFRLYSHRPHDLDSLSSKDVSAVWVESADVVWIGTVAGLDRLDRRTGRYTHFRHDPRDPGSLASNIVRTLHGDRRGRLWVGTRGGGLQRFVPEMGRFVRAGGRPGATGGLSDSFVRAILESRSGHLWVGTYDGGLNRLDPGADRFVHYRHDPSDPASLSADRIISMAEDRRGGVWVGTVSGLNHLDPETGRITRHFHRVDDPGSLSANGVYAIREDPSGRLWVGTENGLNLLDPATGRWRRFFETDGLPNTVIYAILPDADGFLWLSTNRGLSRLDPEALTFTNYDDTDGLQGNEFNIGVAHAGPGGELFFGGVNGLNSFFPQALASNPVPPVPVLTGLQLFNKPVAVGAEVGGRVLLEKSLPETESVTLSHSESVVTLEFASLHYTFPSANRHAFKMDGFDADWNDVGTRRIATYTNLSPGTYTFRVKAANSDGVWSTRDAALRITVTPPVWATWWFRTVAVLVLAAGVVSLIQVRTRGIRRRAQELEDRVGRRTAELRAANDALTQSERDYRELFESAHDAIVILTPEDEIILDANQRACELYGYTRQELIGISMEELSTDVPGGKQAIDRLLTQGSVYNLARTHRRKDGALMLLEVNGSVIRYRGRSALLFIGRDITERVRLEEQLRQSQKMETIGRLAGGIAHDFNNLLTCIIGYAELSQRDRSLSARHADNLAQILEASNHARDLVHQLLAFGRKAMIRPVALDLSAEVQSFQAVLQRAVGEDVRFELRLDPGAGRVQADPGQVKQILMNLAVNARDAMPRGGTLTIETGAVVLDEGYLRRFPDVAPGRYVMLSVTDTGCGMDEQVLSHIFEPFFTTKGLAVGTGLGLATVYGIVKQSRGHVEVASRVGHGSTFRVYLPQAEVPAEAPRAAAVAAPPPRASATILVVEDQELVREMIVSVLADSGYRVIGASSAEDACRVWAEQGAGVDAVLTDVVMPGASGKELVDGLVAARPDLRVLYMSGYTDDVLTLHGVSSQGHGFLQKPFTPSQLVHALAGLLDPARSGTRLA